MMKGEIIFVSILLVVATYMLYESFKYPLLAGLFPSLLIATLYFLSASILINSVKTRRGSGAESTDKVRLLQVTPAVLIFLLPLLIYLLGFYFGIAVFQVLLLKYFRYSWVKTILLTCLTELMTYLFSLAYPLPIGLIFSMTP
jgi:hypothetical protein